MALWPLIPRMRISIHALREEGDPVRFRPPVQEIISIHALREEGDPSPRRSSSRRSNFYPRPPRGGRQGHGRRGRVHSKISIHALREEGDAIDANGYAIPGKFLSTPSARRATCLRRPQEPPPRISIHALREEGDVELLVDVVRDPDISIHALREEGDAVLTRCMRPSMNFYPRPPRGGRQQKQRQNLYFLINYTTFCTNLEEL